MKRAVIVILSILVVAVLGFVIWASLPAGPDAEALTALESGDGVDVYQLPGVTVMMPASYLPEIGLIFYPGARVDYRSYAPLMRTISRAGYFTAVVKMPLNMAIFSSNRAGDIIYSYPQVKTWVLAGHSLGGAMAAQFAGQNPDNVDGLALWAAYPASSNDLSGSELRVISIYGTHDGLATLEKIDASRPLLPMDTIWVEIIGGNHAQFGAYGEQGGDGAAEISLAEQHSQITSAMLEWLSGFSN